MQKTEESVNAALVICGSLLGDCYLLAEIIGFEMTDAFVLLRKEKWFKHEIKREFNMSQTMLDKYLVQCKTDSSTNAEYMVEASNSAYDILKPNLFKLENVLFTTFGKYKETNPKLLAKLELITILSFYLNKLYDELISDMRKVMPINYDSVYSYARGDSFTTWWNKAMEKVIIKTVKNTINLNEIPEVLIGFKNIRLKLSSNKTADEIEKEASQYATMGPALEVYKQALNTLGLKVSEN